MSTEQFDVTVIGSGPGGYVAAIRGAQLGLKVALVEKDKRLGGTCTLRGCIPTKQLLMSAHYYEKAHKDLAEFGVQVSDVRLAFDDVQKRKQKVVLKNSKGIEFLMKKNEITVFKGTGKLALPGKVELLRDYLSPSAPWLPFRETTFADYLDGFPATAVNAGMLVGHNTLRLMVMGMADRRPTADELARMIALLEEALDAGALGLSSGLFTAPGSYARPDEMSALCRVVARHNGGYFTHIRDEANKVLESVAEAIDIAQTCGVHVEIVHFKCSGMDNWGKASRALDMIAAAKARGLDVDCDAYPYAAGSNPLKNLLPQWVQAGGVEAMLARLAERPTRTRLRADIARDGLNNWGRIPSWEAVQISVSPRWPDAKRSSRVSSPARAIRWRTSGSV